MSTTRKTPMRWRKAKYDGLGNNMDRFLWNRDHAGDVELWRGSERLAVVQPDGMWLAMVGNLSRRCADRLPVAQAKIDAKTAVLAMMKTGAL